MDVAVPMVQEAQALYPELRACSFDRGFHSRDNRVRLDALLDVNALPGRGYLSRADREREEEESFVAARRAHPAIESAIASGTRPSSQPWCGRLRAYGCPVLAANPSHLLQNGNANDNDSCVTNRPNQADSEPARDGYGPLSLETAHSG